MRLGMECATTELAAWCLSRLTIQDYGLAVLVVFAIFYAWRLLNDPRDKALPQAAARLGLHFSARMSPDIVGARQAEFNGNGREFTNFMRGSFAGRETVVFDHWTQSRGENDPSVMETVVGFRVASGIFFREWGSIRTSHWRAEKMGEWIFVYHPHRTVKPRDIARFVEQARVILERSTNPNWYEPTLLLGYES